MIELEAQAPSLEVLGHYIESWELKAQRFKIRKLDGVWQVAALFQYPEEIAA